MEKLLLLEKLFPTLDIHTTATVKDIAEKLSEEQRELENNTGLDNCIDELIDTMRVSKALLFKICEANGLNVHDVVMKNERKVLTKYPLAE